MIAALKNRIVLALVIVALAQTGVLAAMVVDRVRLLKTGREITLPIVPVDPRDLFRGQYVRLGYDISRVPARLLEGPLPRPNAVFYVVLEKTPDGAWKPVKLTRTPMQETSPERIVLKARAFHGRLYTGTSPDAVHFVRYGIESYFVPEGTGKALEKMVGEKRIKAGVAVCRDGTAALKGLKVDGQLVHKEPVI